jgi:hypothetical protein
MRVLDIVALCVVASAAACSPQLGMGRAGSGPTGSEPIGSGQGADETAYGVVGSTGPITSSELGPIGTVPVMVFGAAFGLDRGMIEQAVASDMQASTSGDARFVPSSQANADPEGYTVVMLFNAPEGTDAAAYCSDDPPLPMSGPAQRYGGWRDVALDAALCRNGQGVRQVRSSADGVSSLEDEGFRRMIGQAATRLAPPGGPLNSPAPAP